MWRVFEDCPQFWNMTELYSGLEYGLLIMNAVSSFFLVRCSLMSGFMTKFFSWISVNRKLFCYNWFFFLFFSDAIFFIAEVINNLGRCLYIGFINHSFDSLFHLFAFLKKNKTKSCLKNFLWQQKWDEQSLKFSDTVIEKKLRSSSQVAVNDVNINNMLISDKFIYGKKENFEKNDSKSYIG